MRTVTTYEFEFADFGHPNLADFHQDAIVEHCCYVVEKAQKLTNRKFGMMSRFDRGEETITGFEYRVEGNALSIEEAFETLKPLVQIAAQNIIEAVSKEYQAMKRAKNLRTYRLDWYNFADLDFSEVLSWDSWEFTEAVIKRAGLPECFTAECGQFVYRQYADAPDFMDLSKVSSLLEPYVLEALGDFILTD